MPDHHPAQQAVPRPQRDTEQRLSPLSNQWLNNFLRQAGFDLGAVPVNPHLPHSLEESQIAGEIVFFSHRVLVVLCNREEGGPVRHAVGIPIRAEDGQAERPPRHAIVLVQHRDHVFQRSIAVDDLGGLVQTLSVLQGALGLRHQPGVFHRQRHTFRHRPDERQFVFTEMIFTIGGGFQRADDLAQHRDRRADRAGRRDRLVSGDKRLKPLIFTHVLIPGLAREAAVKFLHTLHLAIGFFKLAGVAHGDGELVRQHFKDADFVLMECVGVSALDVQRADDLTPVAHGQRHLGAGFRQVGVGPVHHFRAFGIQRDHGLALGRHLPDHGLGADRQRPFQGEQLLPRLTGTGDQIRVLAVVIHQEHLHMVKTEPVTHEGHRTGKQILHVVQTDGDIGDFTGDLQVAGTLCEAVLNRSQVCHQPGSHTVDSAGQLPGFVLAADRHAGVQVALGDLVRDSRRFVQRANQVQAQPPQGVPENCSQNHPQNRQQRPKLAPGSQGRHLILNHDQGPGRAFDRETERVKREGRNDLVVPQSPRLRIFNQPNQARIAFGQGGPGIWIQTKTVARIIGGADVAHIQAIGQIAAIIINQNQALGCKVFGAALQRSKFKERFGIKRHNQPTRTLCPVEQGGGEVQDWLPVGPDGDG